MLRNELSTTSATTYNSATDETRAYDKMGRLVTDLHLGGLLTDSYVYDGLGRRTRHTNDLLGSSAVERTDYDAQGRVVLQTNMAGDATTTGYAWSGTLATTGLGTFGGWTKTVTDPSSNSATENDDYFGRTIGKTDFGSHSSSYTYDLGGRLTQESGGGGQVMSYSWFNTGNLYQVADTAGTGMNAITSTYGYDAAGNRTYEGSAGTVYSTYYGGTSTSSTLTLQNATIAYDALNRITSFTDKDASNVTRITVANEYDLNGNVRRTSSTFPDLAYPTHSNYSTDKYYRYDAMNRMVVADGALVSGAIVRGSNGYDITYDAAGRRVTQTANAYLTGYANTWVWYPGYDSHSLIDPGTTGDYENVAVTYSGTRREEYAYRADGELYTVKFAETGYTDNGDGTVTSTGTFGSSVLRAEYDRDAMGRISEYREFGTDGSTVTRDRYSISYDARNNVTSDYVSQAKLESGSNNTYLTHTTNGYTTYGLLTSVTAVESKNGSDSAVPDTSMSYSYGWYDGARVSSTSYDSDTGSSSNTIFTSTYYYDALGRVGSVDIADGRRRTVSFAYTPDGQVLNRKERSAASANPEDQYYFVNGAQYGQLTSNGLSDPTLADYATNLNTLRNWTPNPAAAPFRWNTTGGATEGNFGPAGYQPLNPYGGGTASSDSTYTVRAGETLQSIAASTWGDASLWYLIADANGMSGAETLTAGTSLVLPDRVSEVHNSANTFKVYDPNQALGDLNPTNAKPPKKAGGCGAMGQVISVVIAVAVTALTGIPALGNIASQGFNMLTGAQHGFSWKSLALSELSAGITGGIDGSGIFDEIGSSFVRGALTAATASALTQGVGVATGLQDKFDWAGVAGAALGGGLGGEIHAHVPGYGGSLLANTAGGIANAGARSLIDGTDFGDNLIAALPDIIGQTMGNIVADGISGRIQGGGSRGTLQPVYADDVGALPYEVGATNNGNQEAIVVSGSRHPDWTPEQWAELEAKQAQPESHEQTPSSPPASGPAALPVAPHIDAGTAIDIDTFNARLAFWKPWIAANDPDMTRYDYRPIAAAFQYNYDQIVAINAAAAPELRRIDMFFGGVIALQAAPAAIPLIMSESVPTVAAGTLALTSDLNHASGIGAVFGQDRLALDYVSPGASDRLDQVAAVANLLHSGVSLVRLATVRPTTAVNLRPRVIDLGLNSDRYTLTAPDLSGFENSEGTIGANPGPLRAAEEPAIAGPTEAYNRATHYGNTPTAADRAAIGAGSGEVADHTPPLVQRYYEGDPTTGEKPGWQMTSEERAASAADRTRMGRQPQADSNSQGGHMSAYSRAMRRKLGL